MKAIELELFTHRFGALARGMGERLRRTAVSTNIKERLDFSCALLDPQGRLVVNAPHIPVHLGALGLCVRAVAAALPMGPGDVAVTNHPGYAGSHLPDVTVITPVYERDSLSPGMAVSGPALVVERHSATLVEPGWTLTVDGAAALVMRRFGGSSGGTS